MTEQVSSEVGAEVAPGSVAPAEKMIPQSQVNKIIGEVKASAIEKARNDALQELKSSSSMTGMNTTTPEQINKMVQDGIQQHAYSMAGQQVLNQFANKMLDPKNEILHPGFAKKFEAVNFKDIPDIMHLANGVENTASVMHDLMENPSKMVNLRQLNQMNPRLAENEIRKLSDSIKMNQQALGQPTAEEPLGQIKPSLSLADNGDPKTKSFKGASYLRG